MFDCRYCGRYTRLRPCCSSVECTRRNEDYDRALNERDLRFRGLVAQMAHCSPSPDKILHGAIVVGALVCLASRVWLAIRQFGASINVRFCPKADIRGLADE